MKKILAALLVLVMTTVLFCGLAQAEVIHGTFLMVSDDEDTEGDDTAEMEAKYKDSYVDMDGDANTITTTFPDGTTIVEDMSTITEGEEENTYFIITDKDNIYMMALYNSEIVLLTQVGQTFIYYTLSQA